MGCNYNSDRKKYLFLQQIYCKIKERDENPDFFFNLKIQLISILIQTAEGKIYERNGEI